MPREARDELGGVLRAEVVKEEERIQPGDLRMPKRAAEVDPGPFDRLAAGEDLFDCANRGGLCVRHGSYQETVVLKAPLRAARGTQSRPKDGPASHSRGSIQMPPGSLT